MHESVSGVYVSMWVCECVCAFMTMAFPILITDGTGMASDIGGDGHMGHQ